MRLCPGPVLLLPFLALASTGLQAQAWSLDAAVGRTAHGALPAESGGLAATFGARRPGSTWLALHASLPAEDGGTAWASGALGTRVGGAARTVLGLDLAAQGHAYSTHGLEGVGSGATVAALPLATLAFGPARLELRSGAMHHASAHGGATASRTVHHSDARLGIVAGAVTLVGETRWVRAAEEDYPYTGGEAHAALGPATLGAFAGRWHSDRIRGATWGVEGRLHALAHTELFAGYRRESDDPLHWAGERTGWSLGVTRRLGGRAVPLPPSAPETRDGRTVFRIPLVAASEAPSLAGDFTGWIGVPMQREGDGWTVALALPAGVHRYAFRGADGRWFVPATVPGRTDDGFGGVAAVVVVP